MPAFFAGAPGDLLTSDAAHVVVMTDKDHTVLTIAPHYRGPKKPFAFIVGVAGAITTKDIAFVPRDVVDRLAEADAPRLVELWEQDPCSARGEPTLDSSGVGEGGGSWEGIGLGDMSMHPTHLVPTGASVSIVADVAALRVLLAREKLALAPGADAVLQSYADMRFVVARIDPSKLVFVGDGASLPPLRVHVAKALGALPFRLGALAISPNGFADVVLHILARENRYDVAGAENTFLAEGTDVGDVAKQSPGLFYSALLDRAQIGRAAVTEYVDEAPHCRDCPSRPLDRADLATFGGNIIPGGGLALGSFRGSPSIFPGERGRKLSATEQAIADAIRASNLDECVNEGNVTVKLDALASGALANVAVVESNVSDRRAEDCVVERLGRLTMEQKPTPGPVSLSLGFRRDWARNTPTWQLSRVRLRGDATSGDVTLRSAGKATRVVPKYVVRHPWTGSTSCDVPLRGRWGTSDGTLATRYASHPIALADPVAGATPPFFEMFLPAPAPVPSTPDAAVPASEGQSPMRRCGSCGVTHDSTPSWWTLVPVIAWFWRRRTNRRCRRS